MASSRSCSPDLLTVHQPSWHSRIKRGLQKMRDHLDPTPEQVSLTSRVRSVKVASVDWGCRVPLNARGDTGVGFFPSVCLAPVSQAESIRKPVPNCGAGFLQPHNGLEAHVHDHLTSNNCQGPCPVTKPMARGRATGKTRQDVQNDERTPNSKSSGLECVIRRRK